MGAILTFFKTYSSSIFFVLTVILSVILFKTCDTLKQERADREYDEKQKEQNIGAFKDSIIKEYNKKLDAYEFTKQNFVVQKLAELEAYNKDLYNELLKVKGDVIAAIKTNVQANLGGISTTGDKLETLDEKTNYYGIKFKEKYSDPGFEQRIVGTSKFHAIPNLETKKWLITPDVTTFDTIRTNLSITYGFKEVDDKYKVFAISGSPKVNLIELNGGYLIDKQPDQAPTIPKRWGIGPYIGYGVSAGTNLPARFGWGIGFSLHYDILQFNMPRIGKK